MKKIVIAIIAAFTALTGSHELFAQYTFKCIITDAESKEALSSVNVKIFPGNISGYTNDEGEYETNNIQSGNVKIILNRVGYKELTESAVISEYKENLFRFNLYPSEIMSGEITVYSPKIENQLKYAILPVSLMTSAEIDILPAISIADAMKTKQGINLVRDGIWANDINIRGLSRDNIVVLINGNRVETANNHAARFALIDENSIEKVEIIKGGVSSIYGSGATGGIVSIKTITGNYSRTIKLNGNASAEYFSVNKLSGTSLSAFLSSDKFNANVYANYRVATDTKTPSGILPNSSFRDYGVSVNAGYKFSEKHNLNFEFQKYETPYAGIPGGYPLFPQNATVTYMPADRDMYALNYEAKDLSKAFRKLSARFFIQNIFRNVEVLPNSKVTIPPTATTPKTVIDNLLIKPAGKHYSKGAMLQSDFQMNNNKLIIGLDAWQRKLVTERERTQQIYKYDSLNNLISSTNLITGDIPIPESKFTSIGFFANDEMSISNDRIYLNLGGRIDANFISNDESVNPLYTITNGVRNDNPPGQKVLWEASERNEISWSLNSGMNFKLYDKLNLSGNFSLSFRSPSLEERYQYIDLGSIVRVGNPDLKPELGYFISAAAKYWGNELNFSLEVYSNFMNDLVSEVPGTFEGRNALVKTNIGKARLAGFESELEYNFYKNFTFNAGIEYVNGENTEDDSALPQIPPLNGTLGLKCSLWNFLLLKFNTVMFDSQNRVSTGEFTTPGYTVYNFYVYAKDISIYNLKLDISSGVENIFDKNYRDHLSTSRGSFVSEPGRNIFLKAKINF
ncbi:MAG: Vitamin B12 transporter BtuB [Ignavibacteria bacterium]|nr:Vitamin B12 transporter BtuB [Ignavibacteria bacterium]